MIKAAIFDFDDTLLATRKTRFSALKKAAADFGFSLIDKTILKHWGKPFRQLIKGILPKANYRKFYPHYRKVMHDFPPQILPGAKRLLKSMKKHNIQILLVSQSSYNLVKQDMQEIGLWKYVAKLWASENRKYHKPDPRYVGPVLKFLKTQKIPKENIVYFGDALSDFKVAKANNILFYAVLSGSLYSSADFERAGLGKDRILKSLKTCPLLGKL